MTEIKIKSARRKDLQRILPLFENGRKFMREQGNMTQWINGYPSKNDILEDIDNQVCFIGEDDEGEIALVFAFIIGPDSTYDLIEKGEWLNDLPYGVIHRIVSSGKHSGMLKEAVEFGLKHIANLRIDTHSDNKPMRKALSKLGFNECGIIYCRDGSPRVAYHKIKEGDTHLTKITDKIP